MEEQGQRKVSAKYCFCVLKNCFCSEAMHKEHTHQTGLVSGLDTDGIALTGQKVDANKVDMVEVAYKWNMEDK